MLPAGFIQDLLARVDIVEVVGRHVELKKAGINHKGLCPFHGEKTPSFIVSPSRQSYHCFGCGAHGDAIRFLTEHAGLGFIDAIKELADGVGLEVPRQRLSDDERARADEQRAQAESLGDVLARAQEHYRTALKSAPRAIDYLKARGLTGEIAVRFGLGYAAPGWRTLASVFPSYDDPHLVDAGLVIVQGDDDQAGQRRYDRFRDRIMFPIRSVRGAVIGFGGRVIDAGEPKYLNSPETPLFHKGRELYGLYEARQAIREAGFALVVEGYMDVVALAQAGLPNAVATLGTACTDEHVGKLFRFTEQVVFAFDGDLAGRRAAVRALEAALPHATDTRSVRFLFLPPEHDPDSFVRKLGRQAFEQAVTAATPLSALLLTQAADGCDLATAEGRAKTISQARPLIERLPDGVLRGQIQAELARRVEMTPDALRRHWGPRPVDHRVDPSHAPRPALPRRLATAQTATLLDRACWLLAGHPALWDQLSTDAHDLLHAQPAPYGAFVASLERVVHEHGPLAFSPLLDDICAAGMHEELSALASRLRRFHDVPQDDPDAAMSAVLHRLRQQAIDDELQWLVESGELSEEARARRDQLFAMRARLKAVPPPP